MTVEATFRGVSSILLKRRAFSVAAEASQILPTSEKQITNFRTAESDPVSICYFILFSDPTLVHFLTVYELKVLCYSYVW